MTIGEIMSHLTFLFIGLFGIFAHIKETNYLILIGSIGIITVIISSVAYDIVTDITYKKKLIRKGE